MEKETIDRGVERLVFATSFGGVAQDEAVVKDGRAFFFASVQLFPRYQSDVYLLLVCHVLVAKIQQIFCLLSKSH